ncbi:cytochrome c oxidase assembly protein [Microbacterium sp. RD1]|uniref:cytochrome c oxidase assembly protein n=1 Tax=Microbacterium sp. RD1 TaxID=3457313 RepID=UPI003FA566CF
MAAASVAGPLASAAHDSFAGHMHTHLLAGMIAPVLLVLAAPATLALRSLPVRSARRLTAALHWAPVRALSSPLFAGALSAGGLWLLYLTPLFALLREGAFAHVLGMIHVLAVGYLLTFALIGRDPAPRPRRRLVAAAVLVATLASHAILAKYLYANPPAGVSPADARAGAQFMYYAGAWVEALVVCIFCADGYRSAGRRLSRRVQAVSTSSAK